MITATARAVHEAATAKSNVETLYVPRMMWVSGSGDVRLCYITFDDLMLYCIIL